MGFSKLYSLLLVCVSLDGSSDPWSSNGMAPSPGYPSSMAYTPSPEAYNQNEHVVS